MLNSLHISNIVLIDRLNLEFGPGLSVLTGETGAGKSILLDALSLALGARSDVGLIRHGCDMAQVTAEFSIDGKGEFIKNILDENGIEFDGTLILRRTHARDGKSKAWVNDVPVSIKTLKTLGDALVEIHGQFENHTLLDQTTHIHALDDFAKIIGGADYATLLTNVKQSYTSWHDAERRRRELQDVIARAAAEREFLEYNVKELSALNPQTGEEEELSTRRTQLMDMEKNSAILREAADTFGKAGKCVDEIIFDIAHVLERIRNEPNPYRAQIDRLYEIGNAASEIFDQIMPKNSVDVGELESAEERLFALRAAARKHRVTPDELAFRLQQMTEQLAAIDDSDAALSKAMADVAKTKAEFYKFADKLHAERIAASEKIRKEILKELPDLKLGQADFIVDIADGNPNSGGRDEVTFLIKTNPGTPFAPLNKIASGGELARFMLALRVVLSHGNHAKTFIFDEVDTGISGAVAAAVGDRLARLAHEGQAIVITHSAQVAGCGDAHFLIRKNVSGDGAAEITTTTVCEIKNDDRIGELARIISGKKITDESIKVAKTLLKK